MRLSLTRLTHLPATNSRTNGKPGFTELLYKAATNVRNLAGEENVGIDVIDQHLSTAGNLIYQLSPKAKWQTTDWRGATKIKLAILPVDGKPARMPKKAGSIWNPLTQEEANTVAAWADYPYSR